MTGMLVKKENIFMVALMLHVEYQDDNHATVLITEVNDEDNKFNTKYMIKEIL